MIHLNALLNYAIKVGHILKEPETSDLESMIEVTNGNAKRDKAGRVMTFEERQALKNAAANYRTLTRQWGTSQEIKDRTADRLNAIILIADDSGARKDEICTLESARMFPEQGYIEVWSAKNKKWRHVPVSPPTSDAIKKQLEWSGDSKWLFPMPSDPLKSIYGQMVDTEWVRLKGIAGITGRLRFHDWRHTTATRMSEGGIPIQVACEILDMSILIFQKVYGKPSNTSKEEWMKRLWSTSDSGVLR